MNSDEDGGRWSPIDTDEWYATRNATTALRDVLTTAGMARAFPRLRAELNAFGQGLIELGRVSPEKAEHPRGRFRTGVGTSRASHPPRYVDIRARSLVQVGQESVAHGIGAF